jgi:exodeoxyribonuclease VII small subunit
MEENNLSYSEAFQELKSIVDELENEEIEIDNLTEKVKRASFLYRFLRDRLRATEEEIRKNLFKKTHAYFSFTIKSWFLQPLFSN